jgi:hypothetical protein
MLRYKKGETAQFEARIAALKKMSDDFAREHAKVVSKWKQDILIAETVIEEPKPTDPWVKAVHTAAITKQKEVAAKKARKVDLLYSLNG